MASRLGFLAVLHSWGGNLSYHPHLHCVVPGGGLAPDGDRWIACRPGFFLPVRVLSRRFRNVLLVELQRSFQRGELRFGGGLAHLADPAAFQRYLQPVRRCEWVVYAKPPFAGPARVLAYLGRYTHRVAISNERILALEDGHVRFRWKDYRQQQRWKTMPLPTGEFIRRVLLHTLPPGFHRIRHFGLLAGPRRQDNLALCRRSARHATRRTAQRALRLPRPLRGPHWPIAARLPGMRPRHDAGGREDPPWRSARTSGGHFVSTPSATRPAPLSARSGPAAATASLRLPAAVQRQDHRSGHPAPLHSTRPTSLPPSTGGSPSAIQGVRALTHPAHFMQSP